MDLSSNRDFVQNFKESIFENAKDVQMYATLQGRSSIGGTNAESDRALLQDELWEKAFNMSDELKEAEDLNEYAGNNYWRNEIVYNVEDLSSDYS